AEPPLRQVSVTRTRIRRQERGSVVSFWTFHSSPVLGQKGITKPLSCLRPSLPAYGPADHVRSFPVRFFRVLADRLVRDSVKSKHSCKQLDGRFEFCDHRFGDTQV